MSGDWVRFAGGEGARPLGDSGPYSVGVIANLSACTGCERWRERIAGRFVEVDRDSLDELLARVAPRLDLDLPGVPPFSITAFEHFRPEGLATRIAPLAALRAARDAADDPDRLALLLAEAGAVLAEATPPEAGGSAKTPRAAGTESGAALLDTLLDRGSAAGSEAASPPRRSFGDPELDRLVRTIADASAAPGDPGARAVREAAIDTELGRRLRTILHHPRFQALEAAWLSLRDLVRNAETGEAIRILVLDIGREDLLAELAAGVPLEATRLHRLVVEDARGTPGAPPFSLLLVDLAFGLGADDLHLLRHLAAVAAHADVPVLAGAAASLWERALDEELAKDPAWNEIRTAPGGDRVALACPCVLLRLPYGADTDPVEGFCFDEEATADTPERYCWGNAAFLIARAIVASVAETGDASDAERCGHLQGLPFHAHQRRGERVGVGPVERVLSDRELERCLQSSLVCASGARGRDQLRVLLPR